MPNISFNSVLIIAAMAVVVPLISGLLPRLPVPGAALEVIAGILIGPSVLGWVRIDAPVQVLSDLGLGMLLFLAGLEIDIERLRGPLARLAVSAFAVSAVLALLCAYAFRLAGQARQPLLLAIILMSTSTGLLLPLLKDAGEESTSFGQLVMTAAALAEIVPIMLLSLFFSATSATPGAQAVSLAIFIVLVVLSGTALAWAPLFLAALLLVRGLPALLYARFVGRRRAVAAGLLQATTLTFVIVAVQIGLADGKITPTAAASLLTAGLLSAILFPAVAQRLLPRAATPQAAGAKDTG